MITNCLALAIPALLLGCGWVAASPMPQSSVHVKFLSPTQNYAHGVEFTAPTGPTHAAPRSRPAYPSLQRTSSQYVLAQPSYVRAPRTFVYSPARERRVLASALPDYPTAGGYALEYPSNDISSLLAQDSTPHQHYYSDPAQHLEEEVVDPLLLTGADAVATVKYLFGRGELYWDHIPHVRALERHQEERRKNGLELNRLSSNRPESPYFRGGRPHSPTKNRRGAFFAY